MSNAVFHDTVTLYLPVEGGYARRVIDTVKVERVASLDGESATVYLPLHGRRSLTYVSSETFDATRKNVFTVTPGTLLVPFEAREEAPPSSALTVTSVAVKVEGSRRLHHLKIAAKALTVLAPNETEENNKEEEIL